MKAAIKSGDSAEIMERLLNGVRHSQSVLNQRMAESEAQIAETERRITHLEETTQPLLDAACILYWYTTGQDVPPDALALAVELLGEFAADKVREIRPMDTPQHPQLLEPFTAHDLIAAPFSRLSA